jgi:hypothetical protein
MTVSSPSVEAAANSGPTKMRGSGVSRDDVSREIRTPTGAAVARPGAGPGFHSETLCSRIVTPK